MKILRIIIGLNLVIFLLPFFNACSDPKPSKNELENSLENIRKDKKMTLIQKEKEINQIKILYKQAKFKYENSSNAYQLAIAPFREFEIKNLFNWIYWFLIIFTVQVFLSLGMLLYSIRNRLKMILILNFTAFLLLLASLIIIFNNPLLGKTQIHQIKVGYYLYPLNLIIILLLTIKKKRAITAPTAQAARTLVL
jgi:hypothetical protein